MIFALVNQKGGVGKTTSTVNLGGGFRRMGLKVLILEVDPQSHVAKWFGFRNPKQGTICDVMDAQLRASNGEGETTPLANVLVETSEGLWLAPGSRDLAALEGDLRNDTINGQFILSETLAPYAGEFDIILIDCGPTLNLLTINALIAADYVVVPVKMSELDMDGVGEVLKTVSKVKVKLNPALAVAGVFATFTDNTRYGDEVEKAAAEQSAIKEHMMQSFIPDRVVYREAVGSKVSIFGMGRGKAVREAADYYLDLAAELLWRTGKFTKAEIARMVKVARISARSSNDIAEVAYANS